MLQLAVCGDGPVAHSIAAVSSARGCAVRVLTGDPRGWQKEITANVPNGRMLIGTIELATNDARLALAGADAAIVCVRHAGIGRMLQWIAPYVHDQMLVGGVPGFGGFGIQARTLLPTGCGLFGTQRVPFVVRSYKRGRHVEISGVRRQTFVGAMPARHARPIAELLGEVLGIRTVPVTHYFSIELSPSNSIVNPARVYALFGPPAKRSPRFGQEFFLDWNLTSSRVLLAIDQELQNARRLIPRDTSFVAPILLQYDANDAQMLTDKFRHLRTLSPRPIPLRKKGKGVTLDARCRYLVEDIDIGLRTVRDILRLGHARTPLMDAILEWRRTLLAPPQSRPRQSRRVSACFASIEALARTLD